MKIFMDATVNIHMNCFKVITKLTRIKLVSTLKQDSEHRACQNNINIRNILTTLHFRISKDTRYFVLKT